MPRGIARMPVWSSLPIAGFINGDTGLKSTSSAAWTNKYINAEELAVIIPISENVLNDADYDIWTEIMPSMIEAFGAAFDAAVLYGTNAPSTWPQAIVPATNAAGQKVSLATFGTGGKDLYDAVLGDNGTYSLVEQDGYAVNGNLAALTFKGKLRGLRTSEGELIFMMQQGMPNNYMLDGQPTLFPKNGAVDPTQSLLVSGDWNQLVWAYRQEISFKIFTEGVITDAAGNIQMNLMQQDAIAMRAVMRLGWQVPNPVNRVNANSTTRYPFATLTP